MPRAGEILSSLSGGTGPSWLSFIEHTTDSLWSVDLFRCESVVLRSYGVQIFISLISTAEMVSAGANIPPFKEFSTSLGCVVPVDDCERES